ncbi:MAG: right-handed parallel beta-helix repeat-containing protein, partial [Verrucomicrobia bacterium]|nr:right-handed parallel beta-helix repeat-containing protein [Verrucomicrobiota bacterium]
MNRSSRCGLSVVILLLTLGQAAHAVTNYVDHAASGADNGSSWANAYTNLADAINASGTVGDQIWVAKGTYTPNGQSDPFRIADFVTGIFVYGGFTNGMATLGQRDWKAHPTYLSADLNGDDTASFGSRGDNAYHAFYMSEVDNTRLDGFIIKGGNAHGVGDDTIGAGIWMNNCDNITIANCVFVNNSAESATAIRARKCLNLSVQTSIFSGNRATVGDSACIGAAFDAAGQAGFPTTVERCVFTGNTALNERGAVHYDTGVPWLVDFENCLFVGNQAGVTGGGAIYSESASNDVVNCTFFGNDPDAFVADGGFPHLVNSIVWSNTLPYQTSAGGNLDPFFTDIDHVGLAATNNNINADPVFAADGTAVWTAAGTYAPATGLTQLNRVGAGWAPG